MTYVVKLLVNDYVEKEKMKMWLTHSSFKEIIIRDVEPISNNDILIVEINTLFDWLKTSRLLKKHKNLLVFPLIDSSMLQTSPIAMKLQLPSLFIKPITKHLFYRNLKKALCDSFNSTLSFEVEDEPLSELFLSKILKGEQVTTNIKKMLPNVVYFIQGWVFSATREEEEGWQASSIIQKELMKSFAENGYDIYFTPFRKHLVMSLYLAQTISAPCYWEKGERILLETIDTLKQHYGIQLYIGVGSIHREPSQLKKSYHEARLARFSPPKYQLSLRYYDEIPTHSSIQTSIDYITEHHMENLSIQQVAGVVNFSPTYFCRLFKKETGHSFVSYLTFVRIQRSVRLLRHTNYTIEQIAFDLGFNTQSYFSTIFKKVVGLSPSEYRATKEISFI